MELLKDTPTLREPLAPDEVLHRVEAIRKLNQPHASTRRDIRRIMLGGAKAIVTLLGERAAARLPDKYLPAANLIWTGLNKSSRVIGHMPTLKVDVPYNNDTEEERDRAQEVEYITRSYDERQELVGQLPYMARWCVGYGYAAQVVKLARDETNGRVYPQGRIYSSYDVYPGWWGPDMEPDELAVLRIMEAGQLAAQYPAFGKRMMQQGGIAREMMARAVAQWRQGWTTGPTTIAGDRGDIRWEGGARDPIGVVEYYHPTGRYLIVEQTKQVLDWEPNPLSRQAFTVIRRFDFDALMGQFDHAIGLMSMMAKMNLLGYIAAEDSVFRETNIIGVDVGSKYERGRHAVNRFPPGTQIDRPVTDANLQQTFVQMDRIERQLRTTTSYPVMQDGQSPNSWVTGQGLDRLQESTFENVEEYRTAFRIGLQKIDRLRLELDYVTQSGISKPLEVFASGKEISGMYDPKVIAGRYRTRRVYGIMAGWDDSTQIVGGLQLVQGEIISKKQMREEMDGVEDADRTHAEIIQEKLLDQVLASLADAALQGDQVARAAQVQIMDDPNNWREILTKWYDPGDPEQPSEDELAALAGQLPAGGPQQPPPDAVTQVLSRLTGGGEVQGGVQTLGRIAG